MRGPNGFRGDTMIGRHRRARRVRRGMGIELFIEDGAYTTLAAAVSILVVLTLLFSSATAVWTLGRSGDVQDSADATALAGSNAIASYYTVATVVDACALSLGLAGFATCGAGLVGMLVPAIRPTAAEMIDAGTRMIEARNEFCTSASRGLKTLESSLPYLAAARATSVCAAQGAGAASYTGTALAVPRESASSFPALEGAGVAIDDLGDAAEELDERAAGLEAASKRASDAKRDAWLADCGADGRCMQERVARLTSLPAAQNPDFESSITWSPSAALDRTRAYYRWRSEHDLSQGQGIEARVDHAARKAFYGFAAREFESAEYREDGATVRCAIPRLPGNVAEVRRTSLYTDAVWPTTNEAGARVLHFDGSCPGAKGPGSGSAALADLDTGAVAECPVCRMGVDDVGRVPAASTSIDNGFEYHLRAFTEAMDDYVPARSEELAAEARAREAADGAGDAFEEALSKLSCERPRIAPPGRYGCVALVVSGNMSSPDELSGGFAPKANVGARGAISASALARDPATRENNALSRFFSRVEDGSTAGGAGALMGEVMGLWGDLLVSYGDVSDQLEGIIDGLLGGVGTKGGGSVAQWLNGRLDVAMRGIGIEPVDLSMRKPVLTDSANVIRKSGMAGAADVQELLRSVPAGEVDAGAILEAVGYAFEDRVAGAEFTVAEIPLPGGGTLPIKIRVGAGPGGDEVGAGSDGDEGGG